MDGARKMDARRQVALGAVFGAAVAVNAALQSLHDAGSFLVQSVGSPSSSAVRSGSLTRTADRKRHRNLSGSSSPSAEETSVFRRFLDDEDCAADASDSEDQLFCPFSATDTSPANDNSASFASDLPDLGANNLTSYRGQKLQVRRKNVMSSMCEGEKLECYLKDSDEENSTTEDGNAEQESSSSSMNLNTKSRAQDPVFMPLLPQMIQSEEAMSAMLQHTTNTVLATLSEVKERRDRMLEDTRRMNQPEEQASLQLVNRFIDALINVGDSLKTVHSALF